MKNNIKKICFMLAAGTILLSASVFAQTETLSLDLICNIIASHNVTEGNFVQKKHSAKDGRNLVSTGTFVFSKEAIILNTTTPIASKMGITAMGLITENANGQRRFIDNSENSTFTSIAYIIGAMFTGNKDALENYFTCQFSGTPKSWSLVLSPKDVTIAATITSLEIKGSSSTISGFVMKLGGNTTTITLSNQTYKDSLSDEHKKFLLAK